MNLYGAGEVATWFIKRGMADNNSGRGELISNLKLQKLLYYAQGCFLALKDRPLFSERIWAWEHGPVVLEVYHEYKSKGSCGIETDTDVIIDGETENILSQVYDEFGQYSAWKLREMTHSETPWKTTNQSSVISNDLIKEYFKANYID